MPSYQHHYTDLGAFGKPTSSDEARAGGLIGMCSMMTSLLLDKHNPARDEPFGFVWRAECPPIKDRKIWDRTIIDLCTELEAATDCYIVATTVFGAHRPTATVFVTICSHKNLGLDSLVAHHKTLKESDPDWHMLGLILVVMTKRESEYREAVAAASKKK